MWKVLQLIPSSEARCVIYRADSGKEAAEVIGYALAQDEKGRQKIFPAVVICSEGKCVEYTEIMNPETGSFLGTDGEFYP